MSDKELQAVLDYRLAQAGEAIEDAELLLNAGRLRATANRIYYACFYATLAALLTKGVQHSKHAAVIASFDREFIRTEQLPRSYSRTLHRAFNERQQDDYMPFVQLDAGEIQDLFAGAQVLVQGIAHYVTKSN
jgi:uncharacterized protein (UPF0332 family)